MNLVDLDTFIRVAEAGSYTQAAAELGVPKSTVSRRVSRLEDALGLELLQRSPRAVSLTEHGKQLHARCGPALQEISDVERALADASGDPAGTLRITAPHDFGATRFFTTLLLEFRRRWPCVDLDIYLTERVVDLVEEGVDVAFRLHVAPLPDSSSLIARRVGTMSAGLWASPAYLDAHGKPRTPRSLVKHDCITHAAAAVRSQWGLRKRGTRDLQQFAIAPAIVCNDFSLILRALVDGAGIGFAPAFLAGPHARRGELVRVLPSWESTEGTMSLVWPATRHMAPRVRALIDFVGERVDESDFVGCEG